MDINIVNRCFMAEEKKTATYKNGQLMYESNYQKGELHGLRREWYENGQVKSKGTYKNGKLC